ncbi:MAG TPA: immunoglobulin domain-containing protein [Lacunisphaera sp.]|nr:immunoglobulin domain-containing protein [Lacunisphaera sp.]
MFKSILPILLAHAALSTWVAAQSDYAAPYVLQPFAGISSFGHVDGRGSAARFYNPAGLATDAAGNVYVAEINNQLVRKVTPAGEVTTLAGVPGVEGVQDGTGASARLSYPAGIAVDQSGNIFVTNQRNVLRKITPAGVVSTLPHLVQGASSLAFDPAGNLYFTQNSWHSIRRITPAGQLEEFAGQNFTSGTTDGPRQSALFTDPRRLGADAVGNLWVMDGWYATPRKISADGTVSSLPVIPGVTDAYMDDLTVDTSGNVVVAASVYGTINRISPASQATVIAGKSGERAYVDGPAATARFQQPGAMACDRTGNLYVVDDGSNVIRKITPQGDVSTFAGMPRALAEGTVDGRGDAARFSSSCLVARAPNGDLLVADQENSLIRRITSDGTVSTVAGQPGIAGQYASLDGTGPGARFYALRAIATDAAGNCFVADQSSIRKVTPAGVVTTIVPADQGYYPFGLAVNATGTIFFTDRDAVLRATPGGTVDTYAGAYSQDPDVSYRLHGSDNGPRAQARFYGPTGLAFDNAGNLYVADSGNSTIRKIAPDGMVTNLAGTASPGTYGSADGVGAAASFAAPHALATDTAGNVYVADTYSNLIRRIAPDGRVTTLVGLARAPGNGPGLGGNARLNWPMSIAATPTGTLYLANTSQIYEAKPAAAPVITTQPLSQSVVSGGNVQLSVSAGGLPAPTYQWYFNGAPFQGATGSTLSFTNARSTDAGDYTVVVTNELGSVTSTKATLTVTTAPVPPPASGGGGGGGAPSPWFLLVLGILRLVHRFRRRWTWGKPGL